MVEQKRAHRKKGAAVWSGLLLGTAMLLGGCVSGDKSPAQEVGLANPAAEYCESVGGRTLIIENAEGQTGYCILPDGERVDQWDFYRLNHENGAE